VLVTVDGLALFSNLDPLSQFARHTAQFTATSTSMRLQFQLTDTSISSPFLDDISICANPPSTCVLIGNPGFEQNVHSAQFVYTTPMNWTTVGASIVYVT
jgi:hypothetical protein